MLSLMFSLCIAGQPCKEVRIADFFTDMSSIMCETNKISMSRSVSELPKNATTKSKFECRELKGPVAEQGPVVEFNFDVAHDGIVEKMRLAKFYGRLGAPMCEKNREHYLGVLAYSAAQQNSTGKLYCADKGMPKPKVVAK